MPASQPSRVGPMPPCTAPLTATSNAATLCNLTSCTGLCRGRVNSAATDAATVSLLGKQSDLTILQAPRLYRGSPGCAVDNLQPH